MILVKVIIVYNKSYRGGEINGNVLCSNFYIAKNRTRWGGLWRDGGNNKHIGTATAWLPACCVSYWESLEAIQAWKDNAKHLTAQQLGKGKWYTNYQVEICQIIKEYSFVK